MTQTLDELKELTETLTHRKSDAEDVLLVRLLQTGVQEILRGSAEEVERSHNELRLATESLKETRLELEKANGSVTILQEKLLQSLDEFAKLKEKYESIIG